MNKLLSLALVASVAFAGEGYKVLNKIKVGGTGGWDYVTVDPAARRVYASHGTSVEVIDPDAAKAAGSRRTQLAPCEGPTGLSIDVKGKKLFPVCGNKVMAVIDIPTFKVIATPAIGAGTDGGGFDPGAGLAFSANGRDATMS